jgi:hypothetical protein
MLPLAYALLTIGPWIFPHILFDPPRFIKPSAIKHANTHANKHAKPIKTKTPPSTPTNIASFCLERDTHTPNPALSHADAMPVHNQNQNQNHHYNHHHEKGDQEQRDELIDSRFLTEAVLEELAKTAQFGNSGYDRDGPEPEYRDYFRLADIETVYSENGTTRLGTPVSVIEEFEYDDTVNVDTHPPPLFIEATFSADYADIALEHERV